MIRNFQSAERSSLEKIWRRCFEERVNILLKYVIVSYFFKLTNAHTLRGRPTLKNDTKRFRNGLVRELKEKQTKLSIRSVISNTHRSNDKSEYQECTCEIDKSLKRGTCIKFESRKICIAGNQLDNSDLDIHNVEDKKLSD